MGSVAEVETMEAEKKSHSIVTVEPRPKKGATAWFVDLIEKALVWMMHDKSNPLHYLSGNFAPVEKETPPCADLPVKGSLPVTLSLSLSQIMFEMRGLMHCDGLKIKYCKTNWR
jgi:hypothetical protein